MASRSWMVMEGQDPRYRLPDDLQQRDPFAARDIGWVEQMRPFIREFAAPGQRVIDPFAGLATTLLAAGLEDCSALGFELNPLRVELARERLARHRLLNMELRCSELSEACGEEIASCDLALTSVPYFAAVAAMGQHSHAAGAGDQLYDSAHYQAHLDHLGLLFHRLRYWLKPDAYCIVMAENLRIGASAIPLAWDLAAILADLYQRGDERLLVYPARGLMQAPQMHSDRSHEYALVFRNTRPASIRRSDAWPWLQALWSQGLNFALHGSAARLWADADADAAVADVDLLFDPSQRDIDRAAAWLREHGFALRSWGRPMALPLPLGSLSGRYAVLAERIERTGLRLRFDLGFELEGRDVASALSKAHMHSGLRLIGLEHSFERLA
ncbi:class I SAM-dependent methyltransferase [Pseudomarimonas arenosa]|uniref:Class I SAM-dependent methyltransferase n=1 Tax=Pseudomarimonas arenosa TaxID=2774145 RepID=A0AAW3ZJW0_9GAMM|nr:class I SAM-dependent methyltransferase [Pseudomarimonas arenosa]MBD8526398.1 class I SAM-dependent methyltransferase [Pseudomarimonas arenosa]